MAGRIRHGLCFSVIALLLPVMTTGCGKEAPTPSGGEPTAVSKTLAWDLSRGASVRQVRWPAEGTAFELSQGVGVDLKLPAGKAFKGRVEKVLGRKEGANIRNLDLFFPAATTDAAYKRIKQLGGEWGIDLRNLDEWHKRRVKQRESGKEDLSDVAFTGSAHSKPLGGQNGPSPAIEVLNSFDKKRPVVVNLSFLWPRPPDG